MRSLRPLAGDDPRVRVLGADLAWWRLDVEAGTAAAEVIAASLVGAGTWNADVRGSAEALGYAVGITGSPAASRPDRDRGASSAQLPGLDGAAAAALLDATPHAGLVVTLRRSGDGEPARTRLPAAIHVEAAAPWAAIAISAGERVDPAVLARRLGAELGREAAASLPAAPATRPRRPGVVSRGLDHPRILTGAVIAATVVATLLGGLALHGKGPSQPASVASPSATPLIAVELPFVLPQPPPTLAAEPEATFGPSIVYDERRQSVLMFGGVGAYSETWNWRPAFHWSAPVQQEPAPAGRFGAAMAYDPDQGVVVLFGGRAQSGALPQDTWVWDGSWGATSDVPGDAATAEAAPSAAPSGGEFPVMAFDQQTHQLLLVTHTAVSSQTWVWTPFGRWTLQPISGPQPPWPQAMAWDPATRSLLLVASTAGATAGSAQPAQTWTWDGRVWHRLADMPDAIAGGDGGMGTDPQSGELVLVATQVSAGDAVQGSGTYTWDGDHWTLRGPAPAGVAGIASDPIDHELLAFVRAGGDPSQPVRDAYAWSGTAWIQLT
jgi:hypothetical protein